ncbi:MAG: host attachment protein [Alphaproteobacteria bacterium]
MPNKSHKFLLVANGNKAIIYKTAGNLHNLERIKYFEVNESRKSSHELGRDKPGRGKEGMDFSMKQSLDSKTDLHKKAKHEFIVQVIEFVNETSQTGEFKELLIIASPEALGEIRSALEKYKHLSSLITFELNKDLTDIEPQEIVNYIDKAQAA